MSGDRELQRMGNLLRNIISRGVLNGSNDGKKWQAGQITLLDGETVEGAERAQQYGITSHPHAGAEVIVVHVGGDRSHPVILACDDRRYRVQGLAGGEVCLYTDEGDKILLKRGNEIEVTTKKFTVNAEDEVVITTKSFRVEASTGVAFATPALAMGGAGGGDATATLNGGLRATNDIEAGAVSLRGHSHQGVQPGGGTTGTPVGG